jgi:hypothetical protein
VSIKKQIKSALILVDKTQRELALAVEVNEKTLSGYLNGVSPIPQKLFTAIVRQLRGWGYVEQN